MRLLMIKADGTFMVWNDSGGGKVKPQNWMAAPARPLQPEKNASKRSA